MDAAAERATAGRRPRPCLRALRAALDIAEPEASLGPRRVLQPQGRLLRGGSQRTGAPRPVKFLVVALGHRTPSWVQAGFEEYVRRMPRATGVRLVELKPERRPDRAAARDIQRALQTESRRIEGALPEGCFRVVLDERGVSFSTRGLAERIERWRGAGRDVAFVIGGADGLAAALKEQADLLWSLSALTLPHQLVRVVVAEQLYRATSLLSGHPYHRAYSD